MNLIDALGFGANFWSLGQCTVVSQIFEMKNFFKNSFERSMDTIMKWVRADYHAQMLRNEASNLYRPPLGEISLKCTKMLVKHKENRFWRQKNQPTSGGIGWRAGKCSDRADFWYVPNPYVNPSNARAIL